MSIKKFLHSCILIEENGKRLLIDPGSFSFIEGILKPKDIGTVDVILYTHEHQDHFYPEVTALFMTPETKIVCPREISSQLETKGIYSEYIESDERREVHGFQIEAFEAPHEPVLGEIPDNLAFLINDSVLHPGDSVSVSIDKRVETLCLPVAAPWLRIVDAILFARKLKPKTAIPIHDAFLKDFMRERMYGQVSSVLETEGIHFDQKNQLIT